MVVEIFFLDIARFADPASRYTRFPYVHSQRP
jgi:hypothetical protein